MGMDRSQPRVVAFVVARLSSSRLPGKQLLPIGPKPLIAWTVEELKRCRTLGRIVLATTADPADQKLEELSRELGIGCFRYTGDVNEVTSRLRAAAEQEGASVCVLISGDCPLIDAEMIDAAVAALLQAPEADYVAWRPALLDSALEGVSVARLRAWRLADDLADRPELKEHQFPLLYRRLDLFHSVSCTVPESLCFPRHRWSVDTVADLEFFRTLYERLEAAGLPFHLRAAVAYVKQHPELLQINAHVRQRKVEDRPRRVGFVIDSGGEYGYGHLSRCRELAWQLVERLGWVAEFVVDDVPSGDLLIEAGFRVRKGTVGRPVRGEGKRVEEAPELLRDFDLLVVDISDRRGLPPGWRKRLPDLAVVVVEQFTPWVRESDLVIAPNVLGKGAERLADWPGRLLEGPEYMILRREVRRAVQEPQPEREFDLFGYFHSAERAQALEKWASTARRKSRVCTGWTPSFLDLLRASRAFVSGFGVSFYEAAALGTVPICWPDSDEHREDALRFYRWWGVDPLMIEKPEDLISLWDLVERIRREGLPRIEDGTPRIVEAMAQLATVSRSR